MKRLSIVLAALVLAGCEGAPTLFGPPTARLEVTGPEVFVNGQRARDGQRLQEGERLRTGANSAARIYWSSGGWLQVNPNSDPVWEWIDDGRTLKVNILFGSFYVDQAGNKIWIDHPLAEALWGSEGAIYADRNTRYSATLIEGTMRLLEPPTRSLRPGETVVVRAGQAPVISPTPPALTAQIEADFGRWAPLLRREAGGNQSDFGFGGNGGGGDDGDDGDESDTSDPSDSFQ